MKVNKILSFMLLSLILVNQSCASEATKLSGKVVFHTDRFDGKWAICTLVDGRVRKLYGKGGGPKWSPDGKNILIARSDPEFRGLIIIRENGQDERRLPTEMPIYMVEWLANGKAVIFSSIPTRKQIINKEPSTDNLFYYDLDTKKTTQLTNFNDGKSLNGLSISPDGKKVLFKRYRFQEAGSHEFYIANSDGSDRQQLMDFKPMDPSWASDGKKIVYTSWAFKGKALDRRILAIYNFETKEEKILLEGKDRGIVASQPVFSPDGTQILFSRWSGLYAINVDGSGLKTILPPKRLDSGESSSDVEPDWTT